MSNYYAGTNAVSSTSDGYPWVYCEKIPQGWSAYEPETNTTAYGTTQKEAISRLSGYADNAKQADAALDSITYAPPARNQMIASVTATYDKCLDTMHRKCHDYAGNDNPYRNFEGATRIGLTVQQGLLIRLQDKFSRLENLLTKQAQVKDESLEDTIEDAINYLAILKARREYEKETTK